jgi:hypothetical protein
MSRLHALVDRPKRTLAALATVLVAVGITAASGADFNATSANPNTTFATGTLSIYNSGSVVFTSTSDMRPGDPARVGTVDIGNAGSLSGNFTLTRGTPNDSDGSNPLSGKLNVNVVDCGTFVGATPPSCDTGDPVKYTGTLAGMSSAVGLGNWAGGEKHRFEFDVDVDTSAGNAYQGDSSTVQFTWNAA